MDPTKLLTHGSASAFVCAIMIIIRSGCLAVHHLVRVTTVSVSLRLGYGYHMVKLKFMDHGWVTMSIRVRVS